MSHCFPEDEQKKQSECRMIGSIKVLWNTCVASIKNQLKLAYSSLGPLLREHLILRVGRQQDPNVLTNSCNCSCWSQHSPISLLLSPSPVKEMVLNLDQGGRIILVTVRFVVNRPGEYSKWGMDKDKDGNWLFLVLHSSQSDLQWQEWL